MAAFDRIQSGIPEMDAAIDNIRLGDNVVWRVSDLSQFRLFMEPYVEQAIRDRRNIIYFRFANHEPLVADRPEVKTVQLPLSHRFETFTVDIHNMRCILSQRIVNKLLTILEKSQFVNRLLTNYQKILSFVFLGGIM